MELTVIQAIVAIAVTMITVLIVVFVWTNKIIQLAKEAGSPLMEKIDMISYYGDVTVKGYVDSRRVVVFTQRKKLSRKTKRVLEYLKDECDLTIVSLE